jgi:hypothetical protein
VSQALDLSLFRLPTIVSRTTAEPALSNREGARTAVKERFWWPLARRLDLTGEGSLVTYRPYGAAPDGSLEVITRRSEALYDEIAARCADFEVPDGTRRPPLRLSAEVDGVMEDKTAQFFLRNIARVERDTDVRRLKTRTAIWQEPTDDWFDEVRYPVLPRPELLDDLSLQWLPRLTQELRDNVYGFEWWEHERTWHYARKYHPFINDPPERISINDLSLDAAPPRRITASAISANIMKQLGLRPDGST